MDNPKYDSDSTIRWGNCWRNHRETGPAVITTSGDVSFFERHSAYANRKRGPAGISPKGYIFYDNKAGYHRLDGPAVIYADGTKEYWVNGGFIDQLSYFATYGAM